MNERILMVINPRAGKMAIRGSFYTIVKSLSLDGNEVSIHFTTGAGDAAQTVCNLAGGYDRIVVCGGDGTLNEAVTGLMRSQRDIPIGYIPCGSTNDFASTLGIPQKASAVVEQILHSDPIRLDLGRFGDRFFTYTASFGAFTASSYATPQNLKNALGHFAYVLNSAKQVLNLKPIRMKITTPDYCEEGDFMYGGVSNTLTIGGVYSLSDEDVELDDGKLEIMMIRHPKSIQEYTNALLNLAARNYDDPNILFLHAGSVLLESDAPVAYTLDGEFGGEHTACRIDCLHKAYAINGKF